MTIKTYTGFSKRKNSTKQPTGGSDLTVTLKKPTSIISPVFECTSVGDNVNYVYVAGWGRYYFVTDIIHVNNGMVEIHCASDPMASAKSDISGASCFVERAASDSDAWLSDSEIIASDNVVQCESTTGDLLNNLNTLGTDLVVRVVGKNGMKNYKLTPGTVQNAFSSWFDYSALQWTNIQDALQSLFVAQANPAQYIKSVKWFPIDVETSGQETCYFGFAGTSSPVDLCTKIKDASTTITKPDRYYNDWRDYDSRFTKCSVFLPGYGDVQLDPKYLEKTLAVAYYTDINTGSGTAVLTADSFIIGTFSMQVGIDVPVGGLNGLGALSGIGGIMQMLGSPTLMVDSFLSASVGGAMGASEAILSPSMSSAQASGNERYFLNNPNVKISVTRLGSSGAAVATKGNPLKQTKTLSTLSGYIQCRNASVECALTPAEKETINGYLNSGFYLE